MQIDTVHPPRLSDKKIRLGYLQILFLLLWTQHTIFAWGRVLLNTLPLMSYVTPYIFPILVGGVTLLSLPAISRAAKLSDVVIAAAALLFWFGSKALADPMYMVYYEQNQEQTLSAVVMFFVGKWCIARMQDRQHFFDMLYKVSAIGVMFVMAHFVFNILRGRTMNESNMDIAYKVLPSIMCTVIWAFKKNNVAIRIYAVVASIFLVFLGTRGAVGNLVLFVAVYYIIFYKNKRMKWFLGIIAILLIFMDNLINVSGIIMVAFNNIGTRFGLSLRILSLFEGGDIFFMNGRDDISVLVLEHVNDRFFGYGLFADRHFTRGIWGVHETGTYVHNFAYELWIEFGVVVGSTILLLIIITAIRCIMRKEIPEEYRMLSVVLFCTGVVKLFFSGSWITEPYLFLLLGYCSALQNWYIPRKWVLRIKR